MQREPFELLVICNPTLKPVGQSGARFYEGCLSVPGYQVSVLSMLSTVQCALLAPSWSGEPMEKEPSQALAICNFTIKPIGQPGARFYESNRVPGKHSPLLYRSQHA